jgi:hypothetical protein
MTKVERQQLIELGILTEDCVPGITSRKPSPELKRQAIRRVKERELIFDRARPGLLLTRILNRLKTPH